MKHPKLVLGTELASSTRAVCSPSFLGISPASRLCFKMHPGYVQYKWTTIRNKLKTGAIVPSMRLDEAGLHSVSGPSPSTQGSLPRVGAFISGDSAWTSARCTQLQHFVSLYFFRGLRWGLIFKQSFSDLLLFLIYSLFINECKVTGKYELLYSFLNYF